jgi:hypothetical protein
LSRTRRVAISLAVIGLIAALLVVWQVLGDERREPAPDPPGTFSFAALGDAPYHLWEQRPYRSALEMLDAHPLRFVVHVGDIFWRPCGEAQYRRALDRLDGLRHPVIYTPGDNEWADCWEPGSGGYVPLERLERIRELFFAQPRESLGGRTVSLAIQPDEQPRFEEFVENARWTEQGVLFATLHLVGSANATEPFPGRTREDDRVAALRLDAAIAWLRRAFGAAERSEAPAVVLALHANLALDEPPDDPTRRVFDPFVLALEHEVARFDRPVLLIQGDDHVYVVDHPLVDRSTGRTLSRLTRLQVPGSPRVGWVRVRVRPGKQPVFLFEPHVVPRWKIW